MLSSLQDMDLAIAQSAKAGDWDKANSLAAQRGMSVGMISTMASGLEEKAAELNYTVSSAIGAYEEQSVYASASKASTKRSAVGYDV